MEMSSRGEKSKAFWLDWQSLFLIFLHRDKTDPKKNRDKSSFIH